MRRLAWENSFRRAFKRRTRKNPALQDRILQVLEQLAEDPFEPALKAHKLSGQLQGLWACSVDMIAAMSLPSSLFRFQEES